MEYAATWELIQRQILTLDGTAPARAEGDSADVVRPDYTFMQ
ncbi:MAG TPA: hypothetical protein VG105_01200 [Paraburkholderia sp.]|jgi:hypothetical protein|nr:hypothetical protein [Paraburkholderia sp.]